MDAKTCPLCDTEKAVTEFYVDRSGRRKDGYHPWCRPCTLAYNREYIKRNPEGNRLRAQRSRVRAKYGITWNQRDRLLALQEDRCAICSDELTNSKTRHIDHCHKSGTVRGILCASCNLGLGNFKDDPDRLMAAAAYLQAGGTSLVAMAVDERGQ